jgi:hypothetical protein
MTDRGRNEFFADEQPGAPPPSRTPAIIAFLVAGAVILTLGFVGSLFRDREPVERVPALRLLAPAAGDTVDNPVVLRFSTPADLRLGRAGWTAGDLHLHAMAGQREIMPAAADITVAGGGFSWRLPALSPGEHRIHLTWAGRSHANLSGPSDTIRIFIRH